MEALATRTGGLQHRNARTLALEASLESVEDKSVFTCCQLSVDGSLLVAGSAAGFVHLYSTLIPQPL